ncbi:MAG: alpha-hydroxy-acid oxidizing protein [Actinobacteria bacterium]|nr:alpha-hydroxy-acid oxidizing protein [Actinomycetota bacterium]
MKFRRIRLNRTAARLERAFTIWDLREIAKRRTPIGPFDYTDGAADSESSLNRARIAYQEIEFVPAILRDVSSVDTSRRVFDQVFQLPFGISPTGFTRLMQTEGEIAGARAAERFGIPFSLSTLGTTSIEDVCAAAPNGSNWFQLYMWKDRDRSIELIERAKRAGVKTLHLTVDAPVAGHRLRDSYNGLTIPPTLSMKTILNAIPRPAWWFNFVSTPPVIFASMSSWNGTVAQLLDTMFDPTMTFEDFKWIRKTWDGNLIIKGVQNLEDAEIAAELGADAVLLSNHGGRQLDRAPVPLHLLAKIKREFHKDYEIHIDTGITHGLDILAAIAHGARFAYIGRAYLYGLMAGGQAGVERALTILQGQIIRNMKLLGVTSLDELEPRHARLMQDPRQ